MKNFEEMLEQVRKPGRYLGNEWNVAKKSFSEAKVRVALCYPDLYEVGMSHLGFRIMYGLLNSRDDILCERAFCPWPDFSTILLNKEEPLFSLESKIPLNKFDIVAFTLAYEMNYTNILEMLSLSKIPLRSEDRDIAYPLVIGGGPCTLNPEPVADFFDLFVIGEGEEVAMELVDAFQRIKSEGMADKSKLLLEMSKIEGVYVPSLYNVKYNNDSTVKIFTPSSSDLPGIINKRIVHNLDKSFYPTKYLVPYIDIIHDRIMIEIMRGCMHRCRFCQASICYRPVRFRSKEKILNLIEDTLKNTGYEEFSLMSLSSGDYPSLVSLIEELSYIDIFKQKGIGLSLPSLRVEDVLSRLPQLIKGIKKTGLTFAPEAGTERLRKLICKEIDMKKLLAAVETAQKEGWRRVKLYFMIGLPTENYSDIDGILHILKEVVDITSGRFFDIGLSISSFIPKPHTPFQWERLDTIGEIFEKQEYIKRHIKSKRIKSKFHKPQLTFIETVLSRGDRRLSKVLLTAFRRGAKFDSWDDFFNFDVWAEAFDKEGIDPHFYTKRKDFNEVLPWEHINTGVSKSWLIKEAKETLH